MVGLCHGQHHVERPAVRSDTRRGPASATIRTVTADHDRRSADRFADDLEKRAARTRRAADSERATEAHLDRELPADGYFCLHDCRWPGSTKANIDHVVIGPTGVWVVDDKVMTHPLRLGRDGRLWSGRYSMTKAVLTAHNQVAAVRSAISATDVSPVLSIHTAELPRPMLEVDGVHVAQALWTTSSLIRSGPKRLHPDEVARLAHVARRALAPASIVEPTSVVDVGSSLSFADVLDPRLPPAPHEPSVRQRQLRRRPPPRPQPWRAHSAPARRRRSIGGSLGSELLRTAIGVVVAIVIGLLALQALTDATGKMLDFATKPTVTYSCMQPGAPGRILRVHWSDPTVIAAVWQTGSNAPDPLVVQPGSNAERGYITPGQVSSIQLIRSGQQPPLQLTTTAPAGSC